MLVSSLNIQRTPRTYLAEAPGLAKFDRDEGFATRVFLSKNTCILSALGRASYLVIHGQNSMDPGELNIFGGWAGGWGGGRVGKSNFCTSQPKSDVRKSAGVTSGKTFGHVFDFCFL